MNQKTQPTDAEDEVKILKNMTLEEMKKGLEKHHPQLILATIKLAEQIGETEACKYARAMIMLDHMRILGMTASRVHPILNMLTEPLMTEIVENLLMLGLKRSNMVTLATAMKADAEDRKDNGPKIIVH